MLRRLLARVALVLLVCASPLANAATCFVNSAATGSNIGTSWANAYTDLQSALAQAGCLQIWVARGTYRPTSGTDRTISFNLRPGAVVYGGFNGTEATIGDRFLVANPTILSGDIGVAGDNTDNSYHVVVMDGTTAGGTITTGNLLSDFTIRDGNANGAGTNQGNGGGLFCNGNGAGHECSPELANLVFENNSATDGGAVYNDGDSGGKSSPDVHDVMFRNNTVTDSGGGMYNNGRNGTSSPLVDRAAFITNSAASTAGAMYNDGTTSGHSSPTVHSSTFYANTANFAGAMANVATGSGHSSPVLRYLTFTGNVAKFGSGGAIRNIAADGDAAPSLSGVILWADQAPFAPVEMATQSLTTPSAEYVITPECAPVAVGCINANPLLRPLQDNDGFSQTLMPDVGSPAIDAGNATNCPAFDQRGITRAQGAQCDLGAVELRNAERHRCYVNGASNSVLDGQSWATAYQTIYPALNNANCSEIWVAKGPGYYSANNLFDVAAFSIPSGKGLYGGFVGTETARSQRDPVKNETTLNGLGMLHVVLIDANATAKNVAGSTVLDGFTITGGNANSTGINQYGGGLFCNGNTGFTCNPTLANLVFNNNSAVAGGALFANGSNGMSSPTLSAVTFVNNHASSNCGALFADGDAGVSSPVLTGVTFTGNTAGGPGGAACFLGTSGGVSMPQLVSTLFDNNYGTTGGAIYADAANSRFVNVTFRGNHVSLFGGAVYQTDADGVASVQFTSVAFAHNVAIEGGAIYIAYFAHAASTASFARGMFAGNTAYIDGGNFGVGGAISLEGGGAMTVSDTLFANNGPSNGGGAIYADFGTVTVDRSAFVGNVALNAGGAVSVNGNATVITNSSFRDNSTSNSSEGGAIAVSGIGGTPASLLLRNATLAGNKAPSAAGGGLSVDPTNAADASTATVRDSIFWGDSAPTDPEVHKGTNGSITIDHGIQQGGCLPTYTCSSESTADPHLLPLFETYGGLTPALMPAVHSPAIDTGSVCTSTDQRGVVRPQGAACDIGAIELTSTDDHLFADGFNAGDFEPAGYDPTQCASVANSLDIYWVEVDGATCVGIEHTDGSLADAADGSFTMTGLSVSNNTCLGPAAYSFTLSADGRTLSGSDTANSVPMTLTRSSDGSCFVGHWIIGDYDLIATIWNFTRQ